MIEERVPHYHRPIVKLGLLIASLLLICAVIFLQWVLFQELKNDHHDKQLDEMEVTTIENLTFDKEVKLYGIIEAEEGIVFSGFEDYANVRKTFYLNDSTGRLFIDNHETRIINEPDHDFKEDAYYSGDLAYIVGEYFNESGRPTFYMYTISTTPEGHFQPEMDDYIMFPIINTLLFWIAIIILFEFIVGFDEGNKWQSLSRNRADWAGTASAAFFCNIPGVTYFYIYIDSNEFLIPPLIQLSGALIFLCAFIFYRSSLRSGDHLIRNVKGDLKKSSELVKIVDEILDRGNFKRTNPDKNTIYLDEYEITIKFKFFYSKDRMQYDGGSIIIGPFVPGKTDHIEDRLIRILNEEFDKRVWRTYPELIKELEDAMREHRRRDGGH